MPRYQNLADGGISEPVYGNRSTSKATSGPMNSRIGALFSWTDNNMASRNVTSRIGISFISIDKAKNYISTEISSWNLNDTVSDAVNEWNADVFSTIRVPVDNSANVTNLRLLYSSLYFMQWVSILSDRNCQDFWICLCTGLSVMYMEN